MDHYRNRRAIRSLTAGLSRKRTLAGLFAIGLAAALPRPGLAAEIRNGFDTAAPHSPWPFRSGSGVILRYEIHLTNVSTSDRRIDRIEVLDADTGATLVSLAGDALSRAVGRAAGSGAPSIAPWQRVPAYLDVQLAPGGRLPQRLAHRIIEGDFAHPGPLVRVARRQAARLGPPLSEGLWAAAYDPDLARGHRRYVYAVDGIGRIPGRHAIDFFRADGQSAQGAKVLAVADAKVVAVRDDLPDPPQSSTPRSVALADAPGNFVILETTDGTFVHYEHLAQGIVVRAGQRVRRGDVIAAVGATGQASRPHLHLHLADAKSALASEGLPFTLDGATVVGRFADVIAASSGGPWEPVFPPTVSSEGVPPANSVVRFD